MTVNILTGFEKINEIINECITREITTDGLLEDVETFVNTYYEEGSIDEPVIWITQHPTTANRQADISQTMELTTPFEFDCGVYDNDLEDANMQSQNLANRVILSVLRNWQTVQAETLPGQRMIKNITLNRYSPLGYVNVKGKSDRVPVTGVVLDVNHIVNWSLCCKQLNNNGE
jgi:hypothetical protein